jgi:hypothetical protein
MDSQAIEEYTIVSKKTIRDLEEEVNRLIDLGWRPIGGVAINETDALGSSWLCQAMVFPLD